MTTHVLPLRLANLITNPPPGPGVAPKPPFARAFLRFLEHADRMEAVAESINLPCRKPYARSPNLVRAETRGRRMRPRRYARTGKVMKRLLVGHRSVVCVKDQLLADIDLLFNLRRSFRAVIDPDWVLWRRQILHGLRRTDAVQHRMPPTAHLLPLGVVRERNVHRGIGIESP